jgi:hypothetical protein
VLLGGALGVTGLAGNEVAAGKKGKKISMCLNGTTVTVKKSKKAQLLGQGATVGACPKSPPPPSCPTTQKLCNGRCIEKTSCCTDADCDACKLKICKDGACACKPDLVEDAQGFCGPAGGAGCIPTNAQTPNSTICCSTQGTLVNVNPPLFQCVPGNTFCKSNVDCSGQVCRGFMCPPIYAQLAGATCAGT